MSFAELMEELPTLTLQRRQMVIRRALALEEPGLNETDEDLETEGTVVVAAVAHAARHDRQWLKRI